MIGACLLELGGDLVAHVAGPALGDVEGDDANWRELQTLEQIADQRWAVGVGHVRLAAAVAEIIEHEIDISTEGVRYNRRRVTHAHLLQQAPKIAAVQSNCESYR